MKILYIGSVKTRYEKLQLRNPTILEDELPQQVDKGRIY